MKRADERVVEVEELSEAEVPLVRKRRRLMRVGTIVSIEERVSANEAMPTRNEAEQTVTGEGMVAREGSQARKGDEERQVLPLVMVPFKLALGEDLATQKKQAEKLRRTHWQKHKRCYMRHQEDWED